jgi:hypothetical protein
LASAAAWLDYFQLQSIRHAREDTSGELAQRGDDTMDTLWTICVCVFSVGFFVFHLRKTHAVEIYATWLCFSFSLVFFYFFDDAVNDLLGKSVATQLHESLTSIDDETHMMLGLLALAVLPQFLTYFLSGLSGSASPPKLVSQATYWALWSFVKFLAVSAGITASEVLRDVAHGLFDHTVAEKIERGLVVIAVQMVMAFFVLCAHQRWGWAVSFLHQKKVFSPFWWLHEKVFTKYRPPKAASTPTIEEIKEAMRKEMIATVREGMREGVREGMQELVRGGGEMMDELTRKMREHVKS